MGRIKDIKGEKYGRLTVTKYIGLNKNKKAIWECVCECGNATQVLSNGLRSGNTKSCGCQNIEVLMHRNIKHNGTHTRVYNIWAKMKSRCNNPKDSVYKYYGAKGINVCPKWLESFEVFRSWALNNGYKENLTIERNDVKRNYEPSNCKWITIEEQQLNKTNTVRITIGGITDTLRGWSKRSGISYATLSDRYYKGKKDELLLKPSEKKMNFIGKTEYKRQIDYYENLVKNNKS